MEYMMSPTKSIGYDSILSFRCRRKFLPALYSSILCLSNAQFK